MAPTSFLFSQLTGMVYFPTVFSLTIPGTTGHDSLEGTDDDDEIFGDFGSDTIDGGLGDDYIEPGSSADDVLYTVGEGDDTIMGLSAPDEIFVTGATAEQIQFQAVETYGDPSLGDILVTFTNGEGSILLGDILGPSGLDGLSSLWAGYGTINEVRISGAEIERNIVEQSYTAGDDYIEAANSLAHYLQGNLGNDTLIGGASGDTLRGGNGNDELFGAGGNDFFIYSSGTGTNYLMDSSATDSLVVEGLSPSAFAYSFEDVYGDDTLDLIIQDLNNLDSGLGRTVAVDAVSENGEITGLGRIYFSYSNPDEVELTAEMIERAVVEAGTSSGDDSLVAVNDLPHNLEGAQGNDTLRGGGGNDTLIGQAGNDVMEGGNGGDLFQFTVGHGHDTITDSNSIDSLTVFEAVFEQAVFSIVQVYGVNDIETRDLYIYFESTTSSILLADVIDGNGIYSGVGEILFDSSISGETLVNDTQMQLIINTQSTSNAADTVQGSYFADVISGKQGDDSALGGNGNDTLAGDGGLDTLYGQDGDDMIKGGTEADLLYGNEGNDNIRGGKGADTAYGGADDDIISGGKGGDSLNGGVGEDTLKGGKGADSINGGGGDDTISGAGGQDTLIGGDGEDRIKGGRNDDSLTGGNHADRFVFGTADGFDTITDFEDGTDVLDLRSWTGVSSFDDLSQDTTTGGTLLYRTVDGPGAADQIFLAGTAPGDFDPSDFIFS